MRRYLKTLAATALIGASIAGVPASPAFAAKPASQRHYTYAGGWGCDYYVYSPDYAPRRR